MSVRRLITENRAKSAQEKSATACHLDKANRMRREKIPESNNDCPVRPAAHHLSEYSSLCTECLSSCPRNTRSCAGVICCKHHEGRCIYFLCSTPTATNLFARLGDTARPIHQAQFMVGRGATSEIAIPLSYLLHGSTVTGDPACCTGFAA